jgi:SAM-dependent methyltransferase
MNIVNWLPRYYTAQKFLRDLPRGARVLDIACGEGDLTKFLAAHGAKVWGADLSEADIRKGFPRNLHPNAAFAVADAGALPFASASFDWVVTFGTLQVLPDDTNAVRELKRVLKNGGMLLLCVDVRVPCAGDLFWEERALRRWLPKFLYSRDRNVKTGRGWLETRREDLIYFRDYPMDEILKKFSGFELLEYDFTLKRFSKLAMDVSHGVRGFPRLGLRPYAYWLGARLDAIFCRGPKHRGYSILVKLRKKS